MRFFFAKVHRKLRYNTFNFTWRIKTKGKNIKVPIINRLE